MRPSISENLFAGFESAPALCRLSPPFCPRIRQLGHTPARQILGWSNTD